MLHYWQGTENFRDNKGAKIVGVYLLIVVLFYLIPIDYVAFLDYRYAREILQINCFECFSSVRPLYMTIYTYCSIFHNNKEQ